MELTIKTKERLNEIALTLILDNLNKNMPNDKIDYFLEHFCRAYSIDFTTISIIKNMYYLRIKPKKKEIAMFCIFANVPFSKLPMDYRTFKKYKLEWKLNGFPELMPLIVNNYFPAIIEKFVKSFVSIFYDELRYVKEIINIEKKDE